MSDPAGDAVGHTFDPSVRVAGSRDHDQLARLVALALRHLGEHRGGDVFRDREARRHPLGATVRDTVSSDLDAAEAGRAIVLLGTLGDVEVGYAVAHVEPTGGLPLAVVDDLFVEDAARGVGVGSALMSALVARASTEGCGGIQVEVLPGDRATKNFFEGFGLVARKITVHRSLDPVRRPDG